MIVRDVYIHCTAKMQSLQVVQIITTGIQSVVRYSGFKSPWPGVTAAIPVSWICETTVPHSTVIWSSFTLVQFFSFLFCTFHFISHLWNSRGSSQSARLLSRDSFHLAAAAPLHLCGSYASHAGNAITWSQLETVCVCQLRIFPLVISQSSACHNYTEYGRIWSKFGI